MKRAGYIDYAVVRRPTVPVTEAEMNNLDSIVDELGLRISPGSL